MKVSRNFGSILNASAIFALAGALCYLGIVATRMEQAFRSIQATAPARPADEPKALKTAQEPGKESASQGVDPPDMIAENLPWEHFPGPDTIVPLDPTPYPDPPPHEGAMIALAPYVVEPPDLIRVEVLEALPGRPITGERLVRPDGKISMDFYGNLSVAGLTCDQIKVKTILHLRKFLPDQILGLVQVDSDTGETEVIDPADSDRVFVEVIAYNSKYYSMSGQFNVPGKLPNTGNETVLDAIKACGDLTPNADLDHIELIRPARAGEPARVYPIDYRAIVEKGDPTANLQLLPGDRLIAHPRKAAEKDEPDLKP